MTSRDARADARFSDARLMEWLRGRDLDFDGRLAAVAGEWDRPLLHTLRVLLGRGLADAEAMPVCRDSGCTEWDPCHDDQAGPCHWVAEDLCSHCYRGEEAWP